MGRYTDVFVHGDLLQQVQQNWAIAVSAGCKLHRPYVGVTSLIYGKNAAELLNGINIANRTLKSCE